MTDLKNPKLSYLKGWMFLVILPWSLRNVSAYGQFVLIETTTGKNLVRGNNAIGPSAVNRS